MKKPSPPANEAERLEALKSYDVLDTPPEPEFDDITKLAAHLCETPIALVSLVDEGRQWFKSRHGLDAEQTDRSISFCGHVVESSSMLVVGDALEDERFSDNPLVTGAPLVRFYAGAPLVVGQNLTLGSLCVIDHEAREFDDERREMLRALSRIVVRQLELRRSAVRARESAAEIERLASTQRRFFDVSLDMLCMAGFDGYFKELNPAWTSTLGFTDEELKQKPFIEFVNPDDRESTMAEAAKLAEGDVTIHFENRYQCKNGGEKWLAWSARADLDNQLIMAAAKDITSLKQIEAELRAAKAEADRANRTKSTFLATMSHELRTPLNSIIGFTNILQKKNAGLEPKELKYLDRIGTNGKHLLRLISDILDLSKLEAGQIELETSPVDVGALLRGVIDKIGGQVEESTNRLYLRLGGLAEPVVADAFRLEQVILNLVSNALKFTSGGNIEIRLLVSGVGVAQRVEVVDTGIGIPANKVDHVFEPFRQAEGSTTRRFGGTGLGLSISRALCLEMGFRLRVASIDGRGSLFAIVLDSFDDELSYRPPLAQPADSVTSRAATPGPVLPTSQRKTVLVVDDDADARAVISRYLEDLGCHVVATDQAETALKLADDLRPDLITLDLQMPGMDGWQALRVMNKRESLRDIPVVVCSGVGHEHRASLVGAISVVDKPLDRDHFATTIGRLLGQVEKSRVLVIEDSSEIAELLAEWAREVGADVSLAANGREGLECLEKQKPDLIVLDLCMPVLDGFEFLRQLRADPRWAGLPVVLCTGHPLTTKERKDLGNRASAIVGKGEHLERDIRAIYDQYLG